MNERQFALALSLLMHVFALFALGYIEIRGLRIENELYEIIIPPLPEELTDEKSSEPLQPPPRLEPPPPQPQEALPQSEIERQKRAADLPAEKREAGEPPESEVVVSAPVDSESAFIERLKMYFKNQWIVPLIGDPAAFMDFDRRALLAPQDTTEALQRLLEARLAEMALSPDELKEIYPEADIVGRQLERDQGIMPLPNIPIGLLAQAARELTKKAIGIFKKAPDMKTELLNLSEAEVFLLHVMWIIGKSAVYEIYAALPPRFPLSADELAELMARWSEAKVAAREKKGDKTLFYPAMARSEVLQLYLARLALLQFENESTGAALQESIIRKIAILNNISISDYSSPSKSRSQKPETY